MELSRFSIYSAFFSVQLVLAFLAASSSADGPMGLAGDVDNVSAAKRQDSQEEDDKPERGDAKTVTGQGTRDDPVATELVLRGLPQRSRLLLGEAEFSRPFHARIVVKNRSSMRLSIRAVDADCGCLDVIADRTLVEDGESFQLTLALTKSSRLARIRRAVRVFFDEASQPLEIQLDVRVVGDLDLKKRQFEIQRSSEWIEVRGEKKRPEVHIEHVRSGRGSCLIDHDWAQDAETFTLRMRPHFSFGHLSDVLRFRYLDTANRARVVEIPIELSIAAPLRFLPSRTALRQDDDSLADSEPSAEGAEQSGDWFAEARMIWARQHDEVDPEELRFAVYHQDQPWDESHYQVVVVRRSRLLWTVACRIKQDGAAALPTHLQVTGPCGHSLGELYFSR